MPSSANFEALYAPTSGSATRPPIELTFTIRPRARRSAGRNACVTATWPMRLISSWWRSWSIGRNSSGAATAIPALFTSPASGASPSSSRAAAIWSASDTSIRTVRTPRPSSRSASSSFRTAPIASKPSVFRCRTVASPMPVEAPVTRTVPVAMRRTLFASFARVEVEEAIRTRRTHKVYGSEPVPRETLDELFELARWAPNHNLTNPWRFRVLGPEALARAEGGRGPGGAASSTARRRSSSRAWCRPATRVQDEEDHARGRVAALHRAARRARPRARGLLAHAGRPAHARRAAPPSAWRTTSASSACSISGPRGRRSSRRRGLAPGEFVTYLP